MRKFKILTGTVCVLAFCIFCSFVAENKCDDTNVIQPNFDHAHPFWGSATVATYGQWSDDGCLYSVSCVTKYRFWIPFGTEAIVSDTPIYCDGY